MSNDPIVIDAGTGWVRAGLTSDDEPRVVRPSVFQGKRPIQRGIVADWTAWTGLLRETFAAMGTDPAGRKVLISDSPLNPKANREKMVSILFDTFGVGGAYVAIDAVLALYQSGRTTGIVLKLGHGVSHTVPIYEGYALPHAIIRLDLAGQELDAKLAADLAKKGDRVDLATAQALKNALAYVALDFEGSLREGVERATHLGHTLGDERIVSAETLFQPAFIGMQSAGVHETTYNSIMKCDVDIRATLYRNIVLSGGMAHLPGIEARLTEEIAALAPPTMKIQVTPATRENAWKGGDALASLPHFEQLWVTRAEYEADGAGIVHRKCF